MASDPTAAYVKARAARAKYLKAIVIQFGIAIVLGGVGMLLSANVAGIVMLVIAYLAAFGGFLTVLYGFWHNILPGPSAETAAEAPASDATAEVTPKKRAPKAK